MVEQVDARDLNNLSAQKETFDVEPRKFGEPFKLGIPSQAFIRIKEGVETRHVVPTDTTVSMVKV